MNHKSDNITQSSSKEFKRLRSLYDDGDIPEIDMKNTQDSGFNKIIVSTTKENKNNRNEI